MPRDLGGIIELAPDIVLEGLGGFLELRFRIEGEGRVMPVAGLFEQAFQTGGPGIAERPGGDHPQAAGLANPFLHLLQPVEARLLLAEAWEMPPPNRSGVLIWGAGVNEDQAVLPYGAAGLGEEEREVEVVNGVEGEHAVQGFILECHLLDAGVDRLEVMDAVSSEMPGELGQHLPADVEAGEAQVGEVAVVN
mgnify:CR=1 FL=1